MSELDEFRRRNRENAITDPEEILRIIRKTADPNAAPYRLELFYDPNTKTILLQGNQAGLESLRDAIAVLTEPETASGSHWHYDSGSGLTKNDVDLIIQRVGDNDTGTHTIDK
ncbi:MAG: hypothetical protein GC179_27740 [Anaerolineaceae bacterium]|nr:hypothetical protein [Anaerolineaceae bacterium]